VLVVQDKGDFAGLGIIDTIEAMDTQVGIAFNPATNQVGQLPQGAFTGHVHKTPERLT
jgi:hypothetical protein